MLRYAPLAITVFVSGFFDFNSHALAQVVRDLKAAGIADRGVVISGSAFNRAEVRRMATEFLRTEAKGSFIARLMIASDESTLNQNYGHGTPHNTYQLTIADIQRTGFPRGPLARLMAIGGRGKISYLEHGELAEEFLSATSDPTILRDGQIGYELLHFTLSPPGPATLPRDLYSLRFFFRGFPQVSVASCSRLFQMVQDKIPSSTLMIQVRSDPWFMEEQLYPAVLAFTRPLELPNSVRYLTAPSVTCGLRDEHINCSGTNFSP